MNYPEAIIPKGNLNGSAVASIKLEEVSEEHLQLKLAEVSDRFGPIGAFIHLNPTPGQPNNSDEQSSQNEKTIVKHVFLVAKHLKETLNSAASNGRGIFMSVTHLDGEFGLGGNIDFDPISGGLFGLVKTLNLEWEPVFCRAVDLDPKYDIEEASKRIVAELMDPNRLITEVGYSFENGRQTLIVEPASGVRGKK